MVFIPDKKASAFIPDKLSPNEYSGLTAEDAKIKSQQIYDISKQHEVSYEGIQKLTNDADDINMDSIFSQKTPDIAIPTTRGGSIQRTRKRTEEEAIQYNMSRVPKTPRAQHMAKEYLRQRKIRKKVESEKTADVKDVLDLNFYLSYFAGGWLDLARGTNAGLAEASAIAIGEANLFRNKPKAMGVRGQDTFLSDNPDMSFIPSVFDVLLDAERSEEVQKLVDLGDAKARDDYYKSKGVIGISEFHDRKDNREYMIWSDTLKALKGNEVRNAIERLQDPELSYAKSDFTEHGLSPNYDRDILLMRNHFFNIEEAQSRGASVAANLSDMGLDMVKYMGEIALLSGVTGAGATKLKTAAKFHRAGVPRLIAANVGTLSSAVAMTAANPARVSNLTIGRLTDKGYVGDVGQFVKTEEGQSIAKALPKSFAEATVTQFIEQKGDDIVKGLFSVGSKALAKLPRGMVSKFDDIANYMKETGVRSFDKLPKGMQATISAIKSRITSINKAGQFNGVFGENLEEYTEQIVKPMLLLDDQYRDASDSFLDRVVKSLEIDPEQVMLQTILFTAIPFATGAIGSSAETINWAGRKVKAAVEGAPTLPQVKNRIDLENSIRAEYGLDRQQSEDVATMLDDRASVTKIEKHIQGFGGEFAEFSFDDHNNRKALATMLVDRGLVSTEAIVLADIVTKVAKEQDATVLEIVNTEEFKNDVRDTEREPVNTAQQTIDDAVDEAVPGTVKEQRGAAIAESKRAVEPTPVVESEAEPADVTPAPADGLEAEQEGEVVNKDFFTPNVRELPTDNQDIIDLAQSFLDSEEQGTPITRKQRAQMGRDAGITKNLGQDSLETLKSTFDALKFNKENAGETIFQVEQRNDAFSENINNAIQKNSDFDKIHGITERGSNYYKLPDGRTLRVSNHTTTGLQRQSADIHLSPEQSTLTSFVPDDKFVLKQDGKENITIESVDDAIKLLSKETGIALSTPQAKAEEGAKLEQPDFIGKGEETKPRGLSKSVEEESQRKRIIESFDSVEDYQVVPMDIQYDKASDIIVNDYEFAKRVAMGIEADVERAKALGIIPEMIYVAVTDKAIRDGDLALVEELAIESGLIAEATTMGQRIRALGELGDHSPIRAINKIRDAREEAATGDEKGTIKNLRKDLAKSQKKLEKAEQKLAEKELDATIKEVVAGTEAPKAKSPKAKGYGSRNKIVTKDKAAAAMKRLGDTSTLFAGISPQKFADVLEVSTFHMEAIGRNFAQWSKVLIQQLGDGVKPHLKDLWKKSGNALSVATVKDALDVISKGADQGKDVTDFSAQIQKLAKALVAQGFDTRSKLVNQMHGDLQVIFPDITKRETSDAISGFGKFRRLSTEEIDTILRDIKGQLQQLSKLQDMAAGIAPAKTGVERRAPSAEERALIKQVNEAKKKGGFVVTDPAKQLKTALDAIKTRLKNSITDLEKQINERKKTVKTQRPSPTDAEIEALKIHRDALRAQFDALFGKSELSMAQRIANAKSRVRTDIKKIEDKIAKGDFEVKKKVAITDDIDLKTLRHAKDNAKRAFDAAREVFENEGGISKEEVRNIVGLSQRIEDTKIAMEAGERRTPNSKPTDVETEYGMAVVAFEKYVEAVQLKAAKKAIPQRLKTWFNLFNLELLGDIAGTAKTIRASMDNSFIGRQGIKLFYLGITGDFNAGKIWMETFMKSIKTIVGSLAGKPVMDVLRAEILSDPQYNLMRRAKVATAVAEEEFPTHWPSKIPAIGMFFKASEDAFTASAYYMRYRTAKMYFDIAKKTGVDLNDKRELESIGRLVNSLTARGGAASSGASNQLINTVLWSPKMIKSNFDTFGILPFNIGRRVNGQAPVTKFVQRQAAKNLIRIIFGQAAVLFIANLIWPDSVEEDRTSSDFGKIKVGNTRFDISGGSGSMIVLAMRLAQGSFKSSTGRKIELDSAGFGGLSSMDLIWNFLENKLSPGAAAAKQLVLMKNNAIDWRTGREVTFIDVIEGLAVPLPFENLIELMEDPDSAPVLIAMLAELHGISALNYKTKFKGFK